MKLEFKKELLTRLILQLDGLTFENTELKQNTSLAGSIIEKNILVFIVLINSTVFIRFKKHSIGN